MADSGLTFLLLYLHVIVSHTQCKITSLLLMSLWPDISSYAAAIPHNNWTLRANLAGVVGG